MSYTSRLTQLLGVAAVIATSSALLTAPVHAAERPTGSSPQEYMDHLKRKEVMQMMDTSNKGFVTKEEFVKFHEELFQRLDKDRDGKVTTKEWVGREPKK